jgi:hypothetical protein
MMGKVKSGIDMAELKHLTVTMPGELAAVVKAAAAEGTDASTREESISSIPRGNRGKGGRTPKMNYSYRASFPTSIRAFFWT